MKKITLFLVATFLISCSNNKISNSTNKLKVESITTDLKKDTIDFSLDTFSSIPEEIDGCGCFFYLSKEDEANSNYIFINDFANTAFVSINNKLEKFILDKHIEGSNIYVYSSGEYRLEIEIIKKDESGNETSFIKGVIKLFKKTSLIEKNFIGSCGC